jgi:xylulose-5-phosphate/fructose-6-phosphate phosphoketolase
LKSGLQPINVPTLETHIMKLLPHDEHPHGLTNQEFEEIFTKDSSVILAYHGFPWLIHRLTYRRTNHGGLHVRGYKEEGTATAPFDRLVKNDMGRFNLIADAAARIAKCAPSWWNTTSTSRAMVKTCRRFATEGRTCSANLGLRVKFYIGR